MMYVYPKFPAYYSTPFVRFGGSGLANCLFVYSRAILLAHQYNLSIIAPAWLNFSLGTYIRNQSDKRTYSGLFGNEEEVTGLKKLSILACNKKIEEGSSIRKLNKGVIVVEGLKDYFTPLIPFQDVISNYILRHINKERLTKVNSFDFSDCVAIHVRLGDYIPERRTPESWYIDVIKQYHIKKPHAKFLLFSDGTDQELKNILELPKVRRVFFGSSIADIVAISRCQYLIGSDSTFSAWGAFLGQVPCHYYRLKSKPVLQDERLLKVDID